MLRSLLRNGKGLVGTLITAVVLACALFGPMFSPHDPEQQEITRRLLPPVWMEQGSAEHLLGTDALGRDVFSRVIHGTRYSLLAAAGASVLAATIGVLLGLVAGYRRGLIDLVAMRLVDIQLAFPYLLLAVTLLAVAKPGLPVVMLILACTGWPTYCRMVRSRVLQLVELDFVQAARAIGAPTSRIVLRHLLPNLFSLLMIIGTMQMAQFILAEATLSFLGLGLPPSVPTWGGLIHEGQEYIYRQWWLTTLPGLAIVIAVSGIGLMGDWLRDFMDPKLRV